MIKINYTYDLLESYTLKNRQKDCLLVIKIPGNLLIDL